MFNALIVKPFGWILCQCYKLFGSYGLAIIAFTIISKLIMLPFQMKSKKGMMDMQRIQPKLAELEKKYKNDKERYALEVQKLYKKEGVSIFGGCLPLLITLPIMIGLYNVVRQPLTHIFGLDATQISALAELLKGAGAEISGKGYMLEIAVANNIMKYQDVIATSEFAAALKGASFNFLGIDLSAIPNFHASVQEIKTNGWNLIIPILSGVSAWFSSWVMRKGQSKPATEQAAATNSMMSWMMPAMSVWIAFVVPAGLGFYWIISNLLSAIQEPALTWYYKNKERKSAELE